MTEAFLVQEHTGEALHHVCGMRAFEGVARCPKCDGMDGQWRGYRRRKDGSVAHRRWCKQCGKWYIGNIDTRHTGSVTEEGFSESTGGPLIQVTEKDETGPIQISVEQVG